MRRSNKSVKNYIQYLTHHKQTTFLSPCGLVLTRTVYFVSEQFSEVLSFAQHVLDASMRKLSAHLSFFRENYLLVIQIKEHNLKILS